MHCVTALQDIGSMTQRANLPLVPNYSVSIWAPHYEKNNEKRVQRQVGVGTKHKLFNTYVS